MSRYWLTPPELELERRGKFDPCPFPRPVDWDALSMSWPKPWYANPPFSNLVPFVRKAISEGGPGVLVFPTTSATQLVIEAGAHLESAGKPRWVDCDTGEAMPRSRAPPCLIARFPLRYALPNVNEKEGA